MSAGPTRDPGGYLRERVVPLEDGRSRARLWVWKIGPRRSAAYLGLDQRSWAAWVPFGLWCARRRAMRRAAEQPEELARLPGPGDPRGASALPRAA